jgi:hypothetical protein
MARVTREKLKAVVKECLIEILAEGIAPDSTPSRQSHLRESRVSKSSTSKKNNRANRRAEILDKISYEKQVNQKVESLTSDPVMASIFADTAMTTLQEQSNAEPRRGHSPAGSGPTHVEDLEGFFGDSAQNWAELAFAEKKPL